MFGLVQPVPQQETTPSAFRTIARAVAAIAP
jgi:hypothetical protein